MREVREAMERYIPAQAPAVQTSPVVRGLLSSHAVPSGWFVAAGQAVDEPVHVASLMQKSPDLPQSALALPATCVQVLAPFQVSTVQALPSLAHGVPAA